MKRSLSILLGIGIIVAGVWVYRTRTPVALAPDPLVGAALPSPSGTSETPPAAAAPSATAAKTSGSQEKSPFDKLVASLKPADQRKLVILDEILKSKNDNDPRLDSEFKHLSPELKRAFTQYYQIIPAEGRNERGTIVFLYARSMSSPQDTEFMKRVLMEKPCRSLADCSKDAAPVSGEEAHLEGINETTANYPQLTGVRQSVEAYLMARGQNPPNNVLAESILSMLRETSQNSPNEAVRQNAENAVHYLQRK